MKDFLRNTKGKIALLCLALAASFGLGYSMNNPGQAFYRSMQMDNIEQSLYSETMQIGALMNNCQTAHEAGLEKAEASFQQLRITSGAMIARIYDGYGDPKYDRESLNYLFDMAHYLNEICLENLTAAEWDALFADSEALLALYRSDTVSKDTLLDELDTLLETHPYSDRFRTSFWYDDNI